MPKSLYRTAPPYSILSDSCMRNTLAQTHTKGCRRFKKQFGGGGGRALGAYSNGSIALFGSHCFVCIWSCVDVASLFESFLGVR